jgi:hypothetical protein
VQAATSGLAILAFALVSCGDSGRVGEPTPPTSFGFSLSLSLMRTGQPGSGLPSPLGLGVTVRDATGTGRPIVGGAASVRDSSGGLLAEANVASDNGHVLVGLAWPQPSALGRSLELRVSFLDASGTVHELERTLTL